MKTEREGSPMATRGSSADGTPPPVVPQTNERLGSTCSRAPAPATFSTLAAAMARCRGS